MDHPEAGTGDGATPHALPRPAVTVHYAQTLDGRIATRNGSSQWISGAASLTLAHELRAAHEAVLVGVGTVLADNPRLTVRLAPGQSPLRIVADSTLRLQPDAHVLTDGAAPTLIGTTALAPQARIEALRCLGAEVLVAAPDSAARVSLPDLLARLAARGVASVLVEGGGNLITALLRERLVDRLIVCIAPKILGAGIDAVGDLGIPHLAGALTFASGCFMPLGEDMIFDGRIAPACVAGDGEHAGADGDRGLVSAGTGGVAAPRAAAGGRG